MTPGRWCERSFRVLMVILSGVLITSCDSAGDRPEPQNTFTMSLDESPQSLDPARSSSLYDEFILVNVYDTLYRYKYLSRPYALTPNLAEAMPEFSEDGLTLTLRIKQGVRFRDHPVFDQGQGREVTAEDVVYSLLRHFDPATGSSGQWLWQGRIAGLDQWQQDGADYQQPVSGLKALDRYTLQIGLTEPYPQILYSLATGYSAIVPREAVEAGGGLLAGTSIGSGPYHVESFDRTQVTLSRNPTYRSERINLDDEGYQPELHESYGLAALEGRQVPITDHIRIQFSTEPVSRWQSFLKPDETQMIAVPIQMKDQVLRFDNGLLSIDPAFDARYYTRLSIESGFIHFDFNMGNPRIGQHQDPGINAANQQLRCRIRDAVDLDEINRKFYGGLAQVADGVQLPGVFEPDTPASGDQDRPSTALQAMEEIDWPSVRFGASASVQSRQIFELIRSRLMTLGMPAEQFQLELFPTIGALYRAIAEGEIDLVFTAWTLDYPDPENIFQLFYGPNASPGSNSARYRNEAYDQWFEQARVMPDSAARQALYQRMHQQLQDQCVTLASLSRRRLYAWHREVIAFPDRDIVGGTMLRFVALTPESDPDR